MLKVETTLRVDQVNAPWNRGRPLYHRKYSHDNGTQPQQITTKPSSKNCTRSYEKRKEPRATNLETQPQQN